MLYHLKFWSSSFLTLEFLTPVNYTPLQIHCVTLKLGCPYATLLSQVSVSSIQSFESLVRRWHFFSKLWFKIVATADLHEQAEFQIMVSSKHFPTHTWSQQEISSKPVQIFLKYSQILLFFTTQQQKPKSLTKYC